MGVSNNLLYPQEVFERYRPTTTLAVILNTFVTTDRSTLDNFTAAREHFRNNVSMGRIDQSHAQKESGDTHRQLTLCNFLAWYWYVARGLRPTALKHAEC